MTGSIVQRVSLHATTVCIILYSIQHSRELQLLRLSGRGIQVEIIQREVKEVALISFLEIRHKAVPL